MVVFAKRNLTIDRVIVAQIISYDESELVAVNEFSPMSRWLAITIGLWGPIK